MINNRTLASNEQSMEILNRCAGSYHVLTISRIKGDLSEEIVDRALNLLQERHPRLKSRITGTLDNLCFSDGTEKIPLRLVEQQHSEQYLEVVLEELNKPIESDQGLARVVLISSPDNTSYLLTILHHAIAGFAELWGASVFYCPYCHGWEVRDKPLAIYGQGETGFEMAQHITGWSRDLIFCSDGDAGLNDDQRKQLSTWGIEFREEKIARLKQENGTLTGIELTTGEVIPRSGIYVRPQAEQHLSLAVASEVMRSSYEQGSELTVFTDSNTEDFYEYEDYA